MAAPGWWQFTLLALAAYRLTRLAGWDEFPLAVKTRAWLTGEHWTRLAEVPPGAEKAEGTGRVDAEQLGLPGKLPASDVSNVRVAYRRPILAHLVHCPFCVGAWICFAVYAAWLAWPHATLLALAPLALSGAVGLVAKNLDP